MKKILCVLLAFMLAVSLFAGCSGNDKSADVIPEIVKNTNGGEKWETKIDYSDENNWLAINDNGKDVDVIYFYPTTFSKASDDAPEIADIDDEGMREKAASVFKVQATVFEEDCNIYAPFYRQADAPYTLTLNFEDNKELMYYSASQDPSAALDYYFEHYNNGKPFILAGHSQGSQILTGILANYMKDHPEYSALEAIRASKEMMKGYKMKLFLLQLSFIGWEIVAVLFCCGIGLLWVEPYKQAAIAELYEHIKSGCDYSLE